MSLLLSEQKNTLALQEASQDTMSEKYFSTMDRDIHSVFSRVAKAIASCEKDSSSYESLFLELLYDGFIPAGRIMSNAGTTRSSVTLMNCFVQKVGDSLAKSLPDAPSIYDAVKCSGVTMKHGGGVGYNFSDIRPKTALIKSSSSLASGPVSYMHLFDSNCATLMSAGGRRGAQMAVLNVNHPDVYDFIKSKDVAGALTNFNISVGVDDVFIDAVMSDDYFDLVHKAEPFDTSDKSFCEERGVWVYQTVRARDLYDTIMASTYDHAEPGVLHLGQMNRENNLYYCETLDATNPCAEQPLPPHGSCNLGSINLTKYVRDPFTSDAEFDYAAFIDSVGKAIRALDNVLDVSGYPLEEQRQEAMNKRRIGLGITGLGDALIMLRTRYDSPEARTFGATVNEVMRDAAYDMSVDLAIEKEPFPLFDDRYCESAFVKRLPKRLQNRIKQHGIRNSHLLSIAPTGTISLTFGDNCSNGIEPAFSFSYQRKKKMPDGSTKTMNVEDHAYRLYRSLGYNTDDLPDYFVSALELDVDAHVSMLVAIQPFIDTSISKTVNIPSDYPFEDFKKLYLDGFTKGLKGLSTFRPNAITGSVLSVSEEEKPASVEDLVFSPDARLTLEQPPELVLDSLRWPSRPETPDGAPSVTYMVDHPQGSFAVFISHIENGSTYPFELWINGAEQPRLLGALAKSLSMDMRSQDREFLKLKLETLMKVSDYPFEMHVPGVGPKKLPGVVSALSHIIDARFKQLDAYVSSHGTPVLDSLLSKHEPKTGPEGTMSWTVDIYNPSTNDDFVLGVKELTVDGTKRPYGLFLSGNYPRHLEGLCESLSIDMRVMDSAWVLKKLRQLTTYSEALGDCMKPIPGHPEKKQKTYPSTVSYIAELLLFRYKTLGITADQENENQAQLFEDKSNEVVAGSKCPECASHSLIKKDGCDFCTSCGHIGSCG